MANFIIFLDRLINMYIYFILCACLLSIVPNINPDYPLFHFIFKFAGFYIIPSFAGITISPALVLCVAALISMGLRKIYIKYYSNNDPQIIVISKDEFLKNFKDEKREEKKDDCN